MKETDAGIEIDHAYGARAARIDAAYRRIGDARPSPEVLAVGPKAERKPDGRFQTVRGRNFKPETTVYLNRKALGTRFVSDTELEIELPPHLIAAGKSLAGYQAADGPLPGLVRKDTSGGRPVFLKAAAFPEVVRAGQAFDLIFKFRAARNNRIRLMHIQMQYPDGQVHAGYFEVSERESGEGSRTVTGFVSAVPGTVKVTAVLYAEKGHACRMRFRFDALPANPFSLTITPSYTSVAGKFWRGAVRYDAEEDKYRCYVKATFSNGNDYDVTVMATPVTVQVRDQGQWIHAMTVTQQQITVPANSSIDTYFLVWYRNNAVTAVFDEYGDAVIRFTYQTSVGTFGGEAIWVRMAQIMVACNFVGEFSSAERTAVREIAIHQASAIYEARELQITSAPVLQLPSSDPDWDRYRDLVVQCKFGIHSDEANDLRGKWSSPPTFPKHVDLWFVESFSYDGCSADYRGFSPQPGPASKSGPDSGTVIQLDDRDVLTNDWEIAFLARTIAHELGHYLGLPHNDTDPDNLMTSGDSTEEYTGLTPAQHDAMVTHAWIQGLNP